jgi:metal-dependent amidase/aminoacylase/carboxypeptidase family protein
MSDQISINPPLTQSWAAKIFAYCLVKVPGCFFFVGACPEDCGEYTPCHNDHFDFADGAIGVGMRMLVELVRQFEVPA